jgi:hypothetical protein
MILGWRSGDLSRTCRRCGGEDKFPGGSKLADGVMRSIAAVYHWPDFQPKVHATVAVYPKTLATRAGTYKLGPNFDLTVAVRDGHLVTPAPDQSGFRYLRSRRRSCFRPRLTLRLSLLKGLREMFLA